MISSEVNSVSQSVTVLTSLVQEAGLWSGGKLVFQPGLGARFSDVVSLFSESRLTR
jgi:hypothetical protein